MKKIVVLMLTGFSFFNPNQANANSLSFGSDGVEGRFTHIWNRIETGVFGGVFVIGEIAATKFGIRHEVRLLDKHPWLQIDLGLESFIIAMEERNKGSYSGLGIGPTGHISLRYALSDRINIKTTLGLTVAGNIELGNHKPQYGLPETLQNSPVLFVPSWQIIGFEWDVL